MTNICIYLISILQSLLSLYLLVILGRVVIDWIQMFSRQWRPRGVVLVVANCVYALTDPPLRWLRRVVPVVRMGMMGIDLSFVALYVGVIVAQVVLSKLAGVLIQL